MRIEILADAAQVAHRAAEFIAAEAQVAADARGRFSLAISGGHTPWQMLSALADLQVPWTAVHLFQVDERVAPAGDSDRNLTHIRESLLAKVALAPGHLHPMPVEERDLTVAAACYASELAAVAGEPPVLDLVHLGLGPDGHTGSLVPGDPVLDMIGDDVALTGVYQGRRRMTLTFPVLDRSRRVMWVVTGSEKSGMLARLRNADRSIPAGRVRQDQALILADRPAAGSAGTN